MHYVLFFFAGDKLRQILVPGNQICLEMQVNEMHGLTDKHHKVSFFLKSNQNKHNSVKYEVIWKWHFVMLIHKEQRISFTCISGHMWEKSDEIIIGKRYSTCKKRFLELLSCPQKFFSLFNTLVLYHLEWTQTGLEADRHETCACGTRYRRVNKCSGLTVCQRL